MKIASETNRQHHAALGARSGLGNQKRIVRGKAVSRLPPCHRSPSHWRTGGNVRKRGASWSAVVLYRLAAGWHANGKPRWTGGSVRNNLLNEMSVSNLSKNFFRLIDGEIGPFDRPFQFRLFPFDAGGSLNFLKIAAKNDEGFATFVSWDLFGHEKQKHGKFGRYELLAVCDDEKWCMDVLSQIGRQGLNELIEPGDTFDLGPLLKPEAPVQGVVFEAALQFKLRQWIWSEACGLLRCIGVTRAELEFARKHGVPVLIERLKRAEIYPKTIVQRKASVDLAE